LVVGPNLSVDQTVAVPRVRLGAIHRVPVILRLAGGKGTNLARALRTLGEDPVLCGFAGGPTGAAYTAYLRQEGIRHQLVTTRADTRVCFSIVDDASGAQTEFYEAGMPVTAAEAAELVALAEAGMARLADRAGRANAAGHGWVALTGSLPPGAPTDLYARLIVSAHRFGLRALLDAREPALGPAIAAAPDVLKINQNELATWAQHPLADPLAVADAATLALAGRAGACAVITLGAGGAVAVAADRRWRILPPADIAAKVRSPVGSGDSAAAGLLVGLRRALALPEAARLAVAAGTANASHLGAGRFAAADVDALLPRCAVTALEA
jgi:1-phosphofructokinase family hexose kinase